ncbi:hypothetical protein FPSE5266_02200 [Fusarium pseudograminearum]|nr:hypothetical protein FPSE5266_02200 [Fusarium pseudograminearum]
MAESEFRLEDHFDGMSIAYIRQALGHDIEYKYSAAWQRVLGQEFKDQWQVVCEQAPHDDDRSRMDFKLDYFDQSEGTISPVVFVELKRPGGAFNVLENQALAVANSAINEYKMNGIYVFTLWGFNFRAWYDTSTAHASNTAPWVPGQQAHDPEAMHIDENPEEEEEDSEAEVEGKGKSKQKTKDTK